MIEKNFLEKELYSVEEASQILNVSTKYLYKKINERNIRCIKLGKKYLILKSEVMKSINKIA